MKKIKCAVLFALLMFCISSYTWGQKEDSLVLALHFSLSHTIDTTQPDFPVVKEYILAISKRFSYYTDFYEYMWEDGKRQTSSINGASGLVASNAGGDSYLRTLGTDRVTTIAYLGETYYSTESKLPAIQWQFSGEQKTILNFRCQKATANYGGRHYTAWFTDQVPYQTGPWKLNGLPGLILEAHDDKNEVVFTCRTIETGEHYKPLHPETSVVHASEADLRKVKDALEKDKAALAAARAAAPMSSGNIVAMGVPIVGPGGLDRKPRKLNNPIEKQ